MLFINWQLKQLNLFIFIFFIPLINSQVIFLNTTESPKLWIDPPDLGEFRIGDKRTIWLIVYTNETAWSGQVIINCEWPKINCPLNETECPIKYSVQLDKENEFAQWINISLKGNFVGLNRIKVFAGKTEFFYRIRTSKTKIYSKLTNILIPIFGVVIGIGNFLTGLQLNICKDGLQPISLFIVFLCQFIFKPLIGFCISKYLLDSHPYVIKLSFFIVCCLPVGASQNGFWSILYNGNKNLIGSIALLQRIGIIFFLPFWIYFVGKRSFFVERVNIGIFSIIYGIILILIPFFFGILLSKLGCQKLLKKYSKYLKPFALIGTLIFIFIILISTWQNFFLPSWDLLFYIGFVLPFTSHIFTLILSKIFCLKISSTKTVVVECGIQNSSVSLFILLLSFGEPERDVALIIPLITSLLTDKLLLLFCFIKIIKRAILALTTNKNMLKN